MKSTRTLLLLTLAAGLACPAPARAEGEEVAAAVQLLKEVVATKGDLMTRMKRVKKVADYDTAAAARGLCEALDMLSRRWQDLEDAAAETSKKFEKYKGYSFKDRSSWETKERLLKKMDEEDQFLRADAAVAQVFVVQFIALSKTESVKEVERHLASDSIVKSRQVILSGLLRNALAEPVSLGKKAMADSNPGVRMLALEMFAIRKDASFVPLAIKALKDKGWPHRQMAARALGEMADMRAVVPLINAMGIEEGRLVEDYAEALEKILGETLGPNPESWKAWADDHKKELAEKGAKGGVRRPKKIHRVPIDYYGIKTRSKRVVFIIDISGSMKEEIGKKGGPVLTGADAPKGYQGPKIEIAKKTLKQAIRGLDESTFFNVIVFNHAVRTHSDKMLQATQDNKNNTYLMVNDLQPSGSTWTYGALKECFQMAGRGVTDKAYDPGVDTIFLLSDGAPTDADLDKAQLMDAKIITEAVREWNKLKKVKIHTIAIDPQIGRGNFIKFMKSLAHQNNGEYTEIGK